MTQPHASIFAIQRFRTAELGDARRILRDNARIINLPTDHLWNSYPQGDRLLSQVKKHLAGRFLGAGDRWNPAEATEDQFKTRGPGGGVRTWAFFSRLFNAVLDCLQGIDGAPFVKTMVNAGTVRPESDRINTSLPDAFLCVDTNALLATGKFRWVNLTCPFEYEFGNGNALENDTKVLWSLHHIMRCDPRRMFSFGCAVHGTELHIWLLCRMALFTFSPFNWFEDPNSLLRFFIVLGASSETDLGFDTNIKRVGTSDFDLEFTVQERMYNTKILLYDIGADAPTGLGSWVFEAEDQETKQKYVIKDCWIEDRPGKTAAHDVVAEIKKSIDGETFDKYFVDICGHRETAMSGGFDRVCRLLKSGEFEPAKGFEPRVLVPTSEPESLYTPTAAVARQGDLLRHTPAELPLGHPPHPRFRYQAIYKKGVSLFEETSLGGVFAHIRQAAEGLHCLHKAGWIYRDPSPGDIVVVGNEAKISGLEFVERRLVGELQELTKPRDGSLSSPREIHMGILEFTAVEAVTGRYFSRPSRRTPDSDLVASDPERALRSGMGHDERIWLHNPLHDYKSIWWIAVWFLFDSKINGAADAVAGAAYRAVCENRPMTLHCHGIFLDFCNPLPETLQPLCRILDRVRAVLVGAYQSFEETFDGSETLLVYQKLQRCLLGLEVLAQNLKVTPKALC